MTNSPLYYNHCVFGKKENQVLIITTKNGAYIAKFDIKNYKLLQVIKSAYPEDFNDKEEAVSCAVCPKGKLAVIHGRLGTDAGSILVFEIKNSSFEILTVYEAKNDSKKYFKCIEFFGYFGVFAVFAMFDSLCDQGCVLFYAFDLEERVLRFLDGRTFLLEFGWFSRVERVGGELVFAGKNGKIGVLKVVDDDGGDCGGGNG